jgi:hypothetical protein
VAGVKGAGPQTYANDAESRPHCSVPQCNAIPTADGLCYDHQSYITALRRRFNDWYLNRNLLGEDIDRIAALHRRLIQDALDYVNQRKLSPTQQNEADSIDAEISFNASHPEPNQDTDDDDLEGDQDLERALSQHTGPHLTGRQQGRFLA